MTSALPQVRPTKYTALTTSTLKPEHAVQISSNIHFFYKQNLFSDQGRLTNQARQSDIVIVRNETLNAAFFEAVQGSQLKVIGRLGAGLNNIDIAAAKAAHIPVVFAPEANTMAVTEYTITTALPALMRLSNINTATKDGAWNRITHPSLSSSTYGIIGYGRIGQSVERTLNGLPFGPKEILIFDPQTRIGLPDNVHQVSLTELFKNANVVSLHAPYITGVNEDMINADVLAQAKKDLVFINAARGELVDETALHSFLKTNHHAHAVLDVRKKEDINYKPETDPLKHLGNTTLTPHIAAFTDAAQNEVVETVMRDIGRVLNDEKPDFPAYHFD